MSSSSPFEPNSHNAMFATILAELKSVRAEMLSIERHFSFEMQKQNQVLEEIKSQTTKTNGRVTKLENFILSLKSKVVVVSGAMSSGIAAVAWMLEKGWIKVP